MFLCTYGKCWHVQIEACEHSCTRLAPSEYKQSMDWPELHVEKQTLQEKSFAADLLL